MIYETKIYKCIRVVDYINGKDDRAKDIKATSAWDAAKKHCARHLDSPMEEDEEEIILVFDASGQPSLHAITVRIEREYDASSFEIAQISGEFGDKALEKLKERLLAK